MSEEMEILPPVETAEPMVEIVAAHRLPNLGHALVFFALAVVMMVIVTLIVMATALGLQHLPGSQHVSLMQLMKDPMWLMLAQSLSYIATLGIAALIFREWWEVRFLDGLGWNWNAVRGRGWMFLGGGLVLGLIAYLSSMGLPIPKSLPVDNYFKTASAVWVIALFGTTLGPMFEEITFRGFLLPALATSWMWVAKKFGGRAAAENPPAEKTFTINHASATATAFSVVLTSVAFVAIHAPQLAGTLSVLGLLFVVSVILTLVRIVTRSVAASTMVHAGYNLWNFVLMFVVTGGFRHLDKLQR